MAANTESARAMEMRTEPRLTEEARSTDQKKPAIADFWQNGAPGTIRQVLYPAELRVRKTCPARPDEGRVL